MQNTNKMAALKELVRAVYDYMENNGIYTDENKLSSFKDIINYEGIKLNVRGFDITIKGTITVDGLFRIGTAFIR
jgi:hypothetical protein